MGIFVGSKQEVSAFRSSGGVSSIKTKGTVAGTSIRNAASGIATPGGSSILAKVGSAISKTRIAGVATALAGKQIAANQAAVAKAPATNVGILDKAVGWVKKNPVTAALIGGTVAVGAGAVAYGVSKARKKRKKKSPSTSRRRKRRTTTTRRTRRGRSRSTRRSRRSYGTEAQYKRRGGLDVKYTRNGQPYVIQRNGRARFIKRSR